MRSYDSNDSAEVNFATYLNIGTSIVDDSIPCEWDISAIDITKGEVELALMHSPGVIIHFHSQSFIQLARGGLHINMSKEEADALNVVPLWVLGQLDTMKEETPVKLENELKLAPKCECGAWLSKGWHSAWCPIYEPLN